MRTVAERVKNREKVKARSEKIIRNLTAIYQNSWNPGKGAGKDAGSTLSFPERTCGTYDTLFSYGP